MISVLIVTYNRAELLDNCLKSIFNNDYFGAYEVIVIDDYSNDNSLDILLKYQKMFSNRFTYIVNTSIKGLSYCKNQGVLSAKGNIIAFTDDDCEVASDWLTQINKIFQESTNCQAVFGIVDKLATLKFPWYWNCSMNWTIGISEINKYPIGSNIALKKDIIGKYFFNLELGPKANDMNYGEDLELSLRFLQNGIKFQYVAQMVVYHKVESKRFLFKHLLIRSFYEGRVCLLIKKDSFLKRIGAFLIGPIKFIICLDVGALLRMVVSIGYVYFLLGRIIRNEKVN